VFPFCGTNPFVFPLVHWGAEGVIRGRLDEVLAVFASRPRAGSFSVCHENLQREVFHGWAVRCTGTLCPLRMRYVVPELGAVLLRIAEEAFGIFVVLRGRPRSIDPVMILAPLANGFFVFPVRLGSELDAAFSCVRIEAKSSKALVAEFVVVLRGCFLRSSESVASDRLWCS